VAVRDSSLAISDSANGRVVIGSLSDDRRVLTVKRTVDGFVNPQGLVWGDDSLFVADPGSHSIHAISLESGALRTVAGNGRQVRTQADLDAGSLSSPWDITMHGRSLFVAMAGLHQLWRVDITTGAASAHCGSGAEELLDAPLPSAALAQPMGIAMRDNSLLFCDSETSAVRMASVDLTGSVHTVVGTGLFDFGDVDGMGDTVRLQHPQSIAQLPDGRVVVADSYNGALKWLDVDARAVATWMRDFEEPAGIAATSTHVFVAETNAHRIVVVDIATSERHELRIDAG
jgi:hypothetical protein